MKTMSIEENKAAQLARQIIETTQVHLFLTGKAGTGKTTFLRRLREDSPKRMVVLAPTGIAAINAGGVTIHSFFQLPFAPYVPTAGYDRSKAFAMRPEKLRIIRSMDLLVIDEVSMVRPDLLDAVDEALRRYRRNQLPFGGVQLLLIGDLQQLAPVVKEEEWQLLRPHYDTPYFFSSQALRRTHYITIVLEKVYRQTDSHFLGILNQIREGHPSAEALQLLGQRYRPGFEPKEEDGYIRLTTHNAQANQINARELARIAAPSYAYRAKVAGKFPDYSYPTEELLELKQGAQIMFLKNDPNKAYYNGMIGRIEQISAQGFSVRPQADSSRLIEVRPEVWTNARYALNEQTKEIEEVVDGTFEQYPVRLAWAITIHKSQGLTFDRVVIDAAAAFAHGQTYVALSRCRTLEGIVLSSPISAAAVIADRSVEQFTQQVKEEKVDESSLHSMQLAYGLQLLTDLFNFEKERIALATVARVFEEHIVKLYPETTRKVVDALRSFDLEVMGVSSRFHLQCRQLLEKSAHAEVSPELQERIDKAASYFGGKLDVLAKVARESLVEVDNKEVAKRLKAALDELLQAAEFHNNLLFKMQMEGFSTSNYLKARAKLFLAQEDKNNPSSKKPTKQKKQKEAKAKAKEEKYALPAEVKHPVLYYRLQEWRRKKALELKVAAFMVLHNKVLLSICAYLPTTAEELLRIPSLGRRSIDKYGADILQLVAGYKKEKHIKP